MPDGYFFLQVLNIRLQSFLLPAESNVIKWFIKGFSRQLLCKLLQNAPGFVVALALGSHAECFNIKTAIDLGKVHTVYFCFTAQHMRYLLNAWKYLSGKSRQNPLCYHTFLGLSPPSEHECGYGMPHTHKKIGTLMNSFKESQRYLLKWINGQIGRKSTESTWKM